MKKSFVAFWRRNLGFANLAIVSNLEYRLNYVVDAMVQPMLTTGIEIFLWYAIFKGAGTDAINGFSREYYLSYAMWAAFFSRISTNWMYESRMIAEIEMGTINGLLTRPMSFYEYYFSQLMGYKFITTVVSFIAPIIAIMIFDLPTQMSRLPMAVLLCTYYLVLVHTMSFMVSCLAFHLNKIHSLTAAKNMLLWVFSGELFPLDLMPNGLREVFISLPFASGVYVPVAYLTGRVGIESVYQGFISITWGLIIMNLIAGFMWKQGIRKYAGTGA